MEYESVSDTNHSESPLNNLEKLKKDTEGIRNPKKDRGSLDYSIAVIRTPGSRNLEQIHRNWKSKEEFRLEEID